VNKIILNLSIRYRSLFITWFIYAALLSIPLSSKSTAAQIDGSVLTFESLLKAGQEVILTARTTGVIKKINVKEGDRVNAGDTLLVLEDEEALAQYHQAKARLEYIRKSSEWDKKLFDKEAISERQYLESKTQYVETEAAMKRAELELKRTRIIAPFEGIVIIRQQPIEVSQLLAVNTPVFSVIKFEPLTTTVYIPEQYINRFRVGTKAEIRSRYNRNLRAEGEVVEKSPVIDPASSTNKLKLIVKGNPGGLIPGMQVVVTFFP